LASRGPSPLCDAAIAIAITGGDGTSSEVAFCLALRRKVVLVEDLSAIVPDAEGADGATRLQEARTTRVLKRRFDLLKRRFDPELAALVRGAERTRPSEPSRAHVVAEPTLAEATDD